MTLPSEKLRQDAKAQLGGLQAHNKCHSPNRSVQVLSMNAHRSLLHGAHQFLASSNASPPPTVHTKACHRLHNKQRGKKKGQQKSFKKDFLNQNAVV